MVSTTGRKFGLTEPLLGHFHERIHRRTVFLLEGFLPLLNLRRLISSLPGPLFLPFEPIRISLGDPGVSNERRSDTSHTKCDKGGGLDGGEKRSMKSM